MHRLTRGVVFLWLGLLASPLVSAVEQPSPGADTNGVIYPRPVGAPVETAPGQSSRYLPTLLAVLAMGAGGGWLFWRARRAPGGVAPLRKLAIAETKSLGNRQFLVVAMYDDKKFLLGVCPGRIDLLTPLDGHPQAKTP